MRPLLFIAAVLLAACSPPASQTSGSATTGEPPAVLTIGEAGAAGITSAIAMTTEAVTAAAPGFYVARHEERIGGELVPVFTLSTDEADMFRLYPSNDGAHLRDIAAISPLVHGPTDETIAVSTYYQAPHEQIAYCEARMVGEAAGFACSTGAAGKLWRVYKLPNGYDGPSEPFDAIDPDAATDATLVEWRWIAPAG